jgi:ribonuclease HI
MHDWICYTDGSVRKVKFDINFAKYLAPTMGKNVFIGGWGLIMLNPKTKRVIESAEGIFDTTISRMELMGPIKALQILDGKSQSIKIYSDSQYVVNSANSWIRKWKNFGWTKDGIDAPRHLDLLQYLDSLMSRVKVEFEWVRGHSGCAGNERADRLANKASQGVKEKMIAGTGKTFSFYKEQVL